MNPELFLQHFDKHVDHIHEITGAPRKEISLDLRYTKSLNDTLERFCQGKWLQGIPNPNAGQQKSKLKRKEVVILDLDDSDDEPASVLPAESGGGNLPKRRKKSITPPRDFLAVMESDPIFFTSPVVPEQREVSKAKPRTEEHQKKSKPKPTAVVNLLSSDVEEVVNLSATTRSTNAPTASSVPSFSTASRSITVSSVPSFTTASRTTTTTSVFSTSTSATAPRKSFSSKPKMTARPLPKQPEDPMQEYSASTRAIMAMLDSSDSSSSGTDSKPHKKNAGPKKKTLKKAASKNPDRQSIPLFDSISPSPPPQPQPKNRTRLTSEERTQRAAAAAQRAAEKTTKASEQAALKSTKDAAKVAATAEKAAAQLLNSVNKLRNSKIDSLPELHVCLAPALASHLPQLSDLLTTRGSPIDKTIFHPPPSLGRLLVWDRNRTASYSEETGLFNPLPHAERSREPHLLLHLTAKEYVQLVTTDGVAPLITSLHRLHPPCAAPRHLILLLEGYNLHLRSIRTASNRRIQSSVRSTSAYAATTTTGPTEATLEHSLLTLQLRHNLLIHHTSCSQESVEWIALLTGDVAQVPYRRAKAWLYRDVAFCAEGRAGVGARDTFEKMLQEVSRVTPAVAEAVVREAGTVRGLVGMLRGEGRVSEVGVGRVGREKRLGVALERRLRGVFCGGDESAMEGL